MQYDTAGNPIIFYDMCAFCKLDTGGNHQSWCPCYPHKVIDEVIVDERLRVIRERSHIKYGDAWWQLARL